MKTLRLVWPQWQGGNRFIYSYGAELLELLIGKDEKNTVYVPLIQDSDDRQIKDGIAFKDSQLKEYKKIYEIIREKNPESIITLGGDCSISLPSFRYLLEKYNYNTAILWFDRHGDISVTGETTDFHAMVLASLLGEGNSDFADFVTVKASKDRLLHVGVNDPGFEFSRKIGSKYEFNNILPEEFAQNSDAVLAQLKKMNIRKVMIHLDLDVLDLCNFRSQSSAQPSRFLTRIHEVKPGASFESISRLINDIGARYDIVGLNIAEYIPWDTIELRKMLRSLPLLSE